MSINDGRPCNGTKCSGTDWCDECLPEVEAFERERWTEYYKLITPIEYP